MLSGPRAQVFSVICGLLAGPTFIFGWVAGGLAQQDEYSWLDDAMSDLGAETAARPWLFNQLGANLAGALLLVFAIGLWRSLGRHRSARIGAFLVGVVGVASFLDGLFRLDCRAMDPGCESSDASWRGTAHGITSTFTFLAFALAPFVLARALKLAPRWRDLWRPTLAFGIGTIATLVGGGFIGEEFGTRVGTTVWFAWIAVLAIRLLRLAGEEAPGAQPAREVLQ